MAEPLRYVANRERLGAQLGARFLELGRDDATADFIERSRKLRHGRARTWLQRVTRLWMSDFDANGLLDMYPMHLASTEQWRRLLGDQPIASLLDVGAGSGAVTRTLIPLCADTLATETSRQM